MVSFFLPFVLLATVSGEIVPPVAGTPPAEDYFLVKPVERADGLLCAGEEPYVPREGDLFFGWGGNLLLRGTCLLVLAGPPSHLGMVVRTPTGGLAILEATTNEPRYGDKAGVFLRESLPRLTTYDGVVWIRRLKCPLRSEQSAHLTAFACAQVGKGLAQSRSLTVPQLSSPRRGTLTNCLFGPATTNRHTWFCSELVTAACIEAGLIDPTTVKPSSVRPRDFFIDRCLDVTATWEKPYRWCWRDRSSNTTSGPRP